MILFLAINYCYLPIDEEECYTFCKITIIFTTAKKVLSEKHINDILTFQIFTNNTLSSII